MSFFATNIRVVLKHVSQARRQSVLGTHVQEIDDAIMLTDPKCSRQQKVV